MSLQAADKEAPVGLIAVPPGPGHGPEQDPLDELLGPDVRVPGGGLLSGSEAALQLQSSAAFSAEALQLEANGNQRDTGAPGEGARRVCCTWLKRLASSVAWSLTQPLPALSTYRHLPAMPLSSAMCCLLA